MAVEPLKKFAVGDMPPSPTTSNPISHPTTHKKPARHQYKRRSSGRIHVTKLAAMTKAHIQQQPAVEGEDDNNDDDDNFEDIEQQTQRRQQHAARKPIKRTHSNKSIHRLSSNDPPRKVNLSGFTTMSKSTAASSSSQTTSPPITPTDHQFPQEQQPSNTIESTVYASNHDNADSSISPPLIRKTKSVTTPSFQVSQQATAAPITNTLNATANTLIAPDKPAFTNLTTSAHLTALSPATNHAEAKTTPRKSHLCSRFIRQTDTITTTTCSSEPLYLSMNETSLDDIRNHHHFRNVANEYQYIQTYQHPMVASLARCMKQRRQNRPTQSSQSQLQRLVQRGAQQRTLSSSILPIVSTLDPSSSTSPIVESTPSSSSLQQHQQHMEHRQMARRRHQRLQAAHTASTDHHSLSTTASSEINKQPVNRWSASALLDRVFCGAS